MAVQDKYLLPHSMGNIVLPDFRARSIVRWYLLVLHMLSTKWIIFISPNYVLSSQSLLAVLCQILVLECVNTLQQRFFFGTIRRLIANLLCTLFYFIYKSNIFLFCVHAKEV
jgi:hypothetical protein